MQVVSIISTKGGVGKTTTAANLGGLAADAGLRVLLLDLDVQPTLSSYYELAHRAPGGIYELLAFNERAVDQLVSRTIVAGLDLVLSNDHRGELNTLLLHAPDGRLRLRHLLPALAPLYDLVLIDTQGARSVLLEMAVLASGLALSPVTPEILAARELRRGTMQLLEDIAPYRHLGIEPPPLDLLINRVHPVSANARMIQQALRDLFRTMPASACWAPTCRPSKPIRALRPAACRCIASSIDSHQAELRPPRSTPCARLLANCSLSGKTDSPSCPAVLHVLLKPGGPMANAHELARGHKRLRALIEFAVSEGWHVKRTRVDTSNSPRPAAPPSTPARPRAITGQTSTPVRRFAEPSARPAWPGPPTPRDAAMAEMTSQDMAGKLLAAGFERGGPSATALSDPIADTPMVVTLDQLRPYDHDPAKAQLGLR